MISSDRSHFFSEPHDDIAEWREAVCEALLALPHPHTCLLRYLLHFLRHYEQQAHSAQCQHVTSGGVAAVFSALLIHGAADRGGRSDDCQRLMAKLIEESSHILQEG
jgi:hypothetical protein